MLTIPVLRVSDVNCVLNTYLFGRSVTALDAENKNLLLIIRMEEYKEGLLSLVIDYEP